MDYISNRIESPIDQRSSHMGQRGSSFKEANLTTNYPEGMMTSGEWKTTTYGQGNTQQRQNSNSRTYVTQGEGLKSSGFGEEWKNTSYGQGMNMNTQQR